MANLPLSGLPQATTLENNATIVTVQTVGSTVVNQRVPKALFFSQAIAGALIAANNLSDIANAAIALSNLGVHNPFYVSGTTAPANSLGNIGDFAFNDNFEWYEKTAAATWTLRVNAVTTAEMTTAITTATTGMLTQTVADTRYAPLGESPGSGARYNFSVSTTLASTASGEIRFDNATAASITAIAIHESDRNGGTMATILDTIGNGSKLQIAFDASEETYSWFNVTAIVDNGVYRTYTVTHVFSVGTRAPGEVTLGIYGASGGGSSTLTVREVDGSPALPASVIEFPNGSLTNQGSGVARVAFSSGGGASGIQYTYSATAGAGIINTAQASLGVATSLTIDATDAQGKGAGDVLARLKSTAIINIAKDAANWVRYSVTADYASGSVAVSVAQFLGVIAANNAVYLSIVSDAISSSALGAGSQPLASGTISATPTSSDIDIASTAPASGGVPPYTYAWYKSGTTGFTVGAGTLVSGVTTAGYIDSGLSPSTTFYYRRVATDGLGNKAATTELTASTTALSPPTLISFWKLNEASGLRVDHYGSNNLTPANGVGFSSSGLIGGGATFSGTGSATTGQSNLSATMNPTLALDIDTPVYVTCAVNPSSLAGFICVASQYDNDTNSRAYVLAISGSKFEFTVYDTQSTPAFYTVTANIFGTISTGQFYIVQAWFDPVANTVNIKINNTGIDSVSVPSSFSIQSVSAPLRFGALYTDEKYGFAGTLDCLGFSKTVPSAAQLASVYNGGAGYNP